MSTSPQIANTLERRTSSDGVVYYVSPLLERAGVPHAFSTRIGGTSPAPFNSFNLGNPNGVELQDDRARIDRHYDMLQSAIGCADRERCYVHQVHGDEVLIAREAESFDCNRKADALVTSDPNRVLSIRTADCVPVLLASEDGRAVAAIHAGWRGVVADVVANAVRLLAARHPSISVGKVFAAIGPSIGFDAFEVGAEVANQFSRWFDDDESRAIVRRSQSTGKFHVDLRQALAIQLRDHVAEIDVSDRCTFRDVDEFYSHRRDRGVTGRMASLIGPRAA